MNATRKWKLHFPSRRWNSQNLRARTASENIHLNPGPARTRRSKKFLKEIHMNGILHTIFKKTQPVMMRKRKMTSGRSHDNSFIVITLYQESNCTCRKRIISYSVEVHRRFQKPLIHPRMYCWRNILKITGTCIENKNCLMDGQASQNSSY